LFLVLVLSGDSTSQNCESILPENTAVKLGEKAVLKCRLASQEIAWLFCPRNCAADQIAVNCALVPSAVGNYKLDKTYNACNLVIDNVTTIHLGTYTCKDLSLNDRGHFAELSSPNDNLALHKNAVQSTTPAGMPANSPNLAVDGIADGAYTHGSCTHTDVQASAWWAVDLGQVTSVGRVRIINRADCCSERLQNFFIGLTNVSPGTKPPSQLSPSESSICKYYTGIPPGGVPTDIGCGCNSQPGRYLYVLLNKTDPLTICELEAYFK